MSLSPELQNLLKAALAVAVSAPDKPKQYEYHIPTAVVTELRSAFEAMGVDWRDVRGRVIRARKFRTEMERIAT